MRFLASSKPWVLDLTFKVKKKRKTKVEKKIIPAQVSSKLIAWLWNQLNFMSILVFLIGFVIFVLFCVKAHHIAKEMHHNLHSWSWWCLYPSHITYMWPTFCVLFCQNKTQKVGHMYETISIHSMDYSFILKKWKSILNPYEQETLKNLTNF